MMTKRYFKKRKIRGKRKIGGLLRVGTISIILIAAFSLLGLTYASWSQSFSIFGSTSTGEINVVVRNVLFESSDSYNALSFDVDMMGNIVDQVNMDVETNTSPFNMILVFIVENTGTIPIVCDGIDTNVPGSLQVQLVDTPASIDVGQIASIRVGISKGYCEGFEFSTFLRFVQATG